MYKVVLSPRTQTVLSDVSELSESSEVSESEFSVSSDESESELSVSSEELEFSNETEFSGEETE
jgi:hypothetical protein